MEYLHWFLCVLIIVSSFFVVFSKDPIESVLCLILIFFNAAIISFIFNIEFLGLSFIIIYVGAIAVLFLFVIIMLKIKPQEYFLSKSESLIYFLPYFILLLCFLFINKKNLICIKGFSIMYLFDNLNNIDVFGQVIYNYYLTCFLVAGLVLLVALVGSIILTLTFKSVTKKQLVSVQLSKKDKSLSFFKL